MSIAGSVLLDTSVIIDHLRGKDPSISRRLEATPVLFVPVIAIGELVYGVCRSKFAQKGERQLRMFLEACVVVQTDEEAAHVFGRVKAELAARGTPIPENDLWIASIAIRHNLPVATRDGHFSAVPGLAVENW
ncbi:MAG: type II toxin-antitoxin system VapC family toxin [Acidobacteria bacterium]|nr:type II toxin-antitoxin system VapC family toxin [Acidobacteriota bacterium]